MDMTIELLEIISKLVTIAAAAAAFVKTYLEAKALLAKRRRRRGPRRGRRPQS